MRIVYFDSGTTNSRAYLIENDAVMHSLHCDVGSRDTSISGNNHKLLSALHELYVNLLKTSGLTDADIAAIYASGMVTSPFGIKELAHLTVPVSVSDLRNGIGAYNEPQFFHRDILLIRGVKTIPEGFVVDRYNVAGVNNMRGEEIEVFGILSQLGASWQDSELAIFLPGSHTHIVFVRERAIQDILSTFSGELFQAIATSTLLSCSIDTHLASFDEEMICLGFKALQEHGISRALYLVNTMRLFSSMGNREKTSFLEGIVMGGVVLAFVEKVKQQRSSLRKVVVASASPMARIYELLLQQMGQPLEIKLVQPEVGSSFAVRGLLELADMSVKTKKG